MPPTKNIRLHAHFSGRVQGVGFRATAWNIARGCGINGFVRNLPDGRVEVVAEGPQADIDAFLAELQRRLDRYIEGIQQTSGEARNEFDSFEIRR